MTSKDTHAQGWYTSPWYPIFRLECNNPTTAVVASRVDSHSSHVHSRLFCSVGLLFATTVAAAQRPDSTGPATLHDVVQFALVRNPDIVTARLHVDSAHGELRISHAFTNPTASVIPGVPFQYGLSSDLDIGPDRYYRIKAARLGLGATRYSLYDTQRQVVFNVRSAFYDLLLDNALASLASDERDILAQLLAADSTRLKNGAAAEADVVTSELNLARADADLAHAQATVRSARLALQLLIGVKVPDTAFQVTGTLRFETVAVPVDRPDSLLQVALAARPDLMAAQAELDQSRALREGTNWLLLPYPNLGVTWQPQEAYPGNFPFGASSHFTLAIAMPVPLWDWFGGEREKAKAGVAVAHLADVEARRQAISDVIQAADSLRSATILARKYQGGLLEKTAQAVANARYAYERGASSLLDVRDAIRTNQDIRTEYLTAVHDYWVAAYSLDRAVGRDLIPDEASPR
jgi:outer membrane protein, heavy metal efflux system